MGRSAHNSNLAIKGVIALGAYAQLMEYKGDAADAAKYRKIAENYTAYWMSKAAATDGSHYKLAYDMEDTSWSQKYNLVGSNHRISPPRGRPTKMCIPCPALSLYHPRRWAGLGQDPQAQPHPAEGLRYRDCLLLQELRCGPQSTPNTRDNCPRSSDHFVLCVFLSPSKLPPTG